LHLRRALILSDDDVAVTPEKIYTILKAAGVVVEPYSHSLFAKACSLAICFTKVCSGVDAAPAAAAAAPAAGAAAASPAAKAEKKKKEPDEEEFDEVLFGQIDWTASNIFILQLAWTIPPMPENLSARVEKS
jgi:large subunit ribosomal protein LP1